MSSNLSASSNVSSSGTGVGQATNQAGLYQPEGSKMNSNTVGGQADTGEAIGRQGTTGPSPLSASGANLGLGLGQQQGQQDIDRPSRINNQATNPQSGGVVH